MKRQITPPVSKQPAVKARTDAGPVVPTPGQQAQTLLESLAVKAADRHDRDLLLATPEPATKDNACWNFALFGNNDDAAVAVDPTATFQARAAERASPYQNSNRRNPEFGTVGPKKGRAGNEAAQTGWHQDVAEQVIAGAGWTLDPNSPLKIAYQWVPDTAMYQHWELWYEQGNTFVSVAKFPGKPVHAKVTETDLADEGLQQVEIGVDIESISALHLQRLTELDTVGVDVTEASVYGD